MKKYEKPELTSAELRATERLMNPCLPDDLPGSDPGNELPPGVVLEGPES